MLKAASGILKGLCLPPRLKTAAVTRPLPQVCASAGLALLITGLLGAPSPFPWLWCPEMMEGGQRTVSRVALLCWLWLTFWDKPCVVML